MTIEPFQVEQQQYNEATEKMKRSLTELQYNYLSVYLLVMGIYIEREEKRIIVSYGGRVVVAQWCSGAYCLGADWLQGPYLYKLYQSYGLSLSEIAFLFLTGFVTGAVAGTTLGSLADSWYRIYIKWKNEKRETERDQHCLFFIYWPTTKKKGSSTRMSCVLLDDPLFTVAASGPSVRVTPRIAHDVRDRDRAVIQRVWSVVCGRTQRARVTWRMASSNVCDRDLFEQPGGDPGWDRGQWRGGLFFFLWAAFFRGALLGGHPLALHSVRSDSLFVVWKLWRSQGARHGKPTWWMSRLI